MEIVSWDQSNEDGFPFRWTIWSKCKSSFEMEMAFQNGSSEWKSLSSLIHWGVTMEKEVDIHVESRGCQVSWMSSLISSEMAYTAHSRKPKGLYSSFPKTKRTKQPMSENRKDWTAHSIQLIESVFRKGTVQPIDHTARTLLENRNGSTAESQIQGSTAHIWKPKTLDTKWSMRV